jgi:hypothetical protein
MFAQKAKLFGRGRTRMNADFSFYPRSSAFVRVQSNEFGFGLSELGSNVENQNWCYWVWLLGPETRAQF